MAGSLPKRFRDTDIQVACTPSGNILSNQSKTSSQRSPTGLYDGSPGQAEKR